MTALCLALVAWAGDQASKLWVESSMALGERTEVLPPVLYWQYHLNPGAAFSMGTDHTWFFTAVMVAVLVFLVWNSRKLGGSMAWALGFGGLAGGVAGNLTDRIFRPPSLQDGRFMEFAQGHVVDFISVPRFAIFNVADSFIVCSILGLCLLMLLGRHIDGSREVKRTKRRPAESETAEDAGTAGPGAAGPGAAGPGAAGSEAAGSGTAGAEAVSQESGPEAGAAGVPEAARGTEQAAGSRGTGGGAG